MVCRYCGEVLKTMAQDLRSKYGPKCKNSPTEKHVAVSDGTHCIYCGGETKTMAGTLRTIYGVKCKNSPTQKHMLDK